MGFWARFLPLQGLSRNTFEAGEERIVTQWSPRAFSNAKLVKERLLLFDLEKHPPVLNHLTQRSYPNQPIIPSFQMR